MPSTKDRGEAWELKGLRVLVAEDAWHVAKALTSTLEGAGMVVVGPAASMADAKRLAAEQAPELAVVDINLKGELAYDFVEELHARGVQVVVVTGYAVPPNSVEKAAAVLQKPISDAQLLATLRQVMRRG
jgi:CheY-like chemotaxis protein